MGLETGRVQVYTGDGKGKTTSALGLALRASGHNFKTVIIQFMKGNTNYGEITALCRIPEIEVYQFGTLDFVQMGEQKEIDYEEAEKALSKAWEVINSSKEDNEAKIPMGDDENKPPMGNSKDKIHKANKTKTDILILDEINVAIYFNLLKVEDVIKIIDNRPPHMEIILTGRRVPQEIIDKADLVTEMRMIKHYYETQSLPARKGIEH